MALSQEIKGTAPVATAPTATPKNADTARKQLHQQFKAEGEALGAQMTEDQKALEGSKSASIAFICALGNPKQKQDRVSGKQSIPCYKPVGYKFMALEDVKVPVFPIKDGYQTLIDVDVAAASEVTVKKGQTFVCNLREFGELISKTQFGGSFEGNGKRVYLGVTFSGSRLEPYPILRTAEGSVKESMELIADVTENADGTKNYTIKDEYAEKFAVLLKGRKASRSGAGTAKTAEAGESARNIARALQSYYAKH